MTAYAAPWNVPQRMEELNQVIIQGDSALWYSWAQLEYRLGNYVELEGLFGRCLKSMHDIRLWRLYVVYVRQSKIRALDPIDDEILAMRAAVMKAFEVAISAVGMDVYSGQIWREYLAFVQAVPALSVFEQQQQMDQVRRIYGRLLVQPVDGLEAFWHEYDAYENSLNKITAKKMLADKSGQYMVARALVKELKSLVDSCDREAFAVPVEYDPRQGDRLSHWGRWIEWERGNPLRLSDPAPRIVYAYRCALHSLWRYPEACLLVNFCLAELHEIHGRFEEAKQVYERLLENSADDKKTRVFVQYMQFCRRTEGMAAARALFSRARKLENLAFHLYVAAAKMEYHCKKDAQVAGRVFELGMRQFGNNVDYVMEYISHLTSLNDDQSMILSLILSDTRSVFERAVQQIETEKAMPVWMAYLEYEFHYGDLKSIQALESRFQAAYPSDINTHDSALFIHRHTLPNFLPPQAAARLWNLTLGTVPESITQPKRIRVAFSAPISDTDPVFELCSRLPLASQYDGPPLNAAAMLRLLSSVKIVDQAAPLPPIISAKSSKRKRNRSKRPPSSPGATKAAPSIPVATSAAASPDLFEQRHRHYM